MTNPAPTPAVGFLATPSMHTVKTDHIQCLLDEALHIAAMCNGVTADGSTIQIGDQTTLVHMALDRAANLLRHAAEELQDERFQALGWPSV